LLLCLIFAVGEVKKMIRQAVKTTFMLMFFLLVVTVSKAEDSAVLVGINHYKRITPDLKYCESDAQLMKETLIRYMDIKEQNIKMLLGIEATRNVIASAITNWLKNRVKPGDRAIFYFSGHGTQCDDLSGDEDDDKDELLCAYDSYNRIRSYIKDDDLNRWFADIKADFKLVILDCCHSGTGTKEIFIGTTIKEGLLPPGIGIKSEESQPGELEDANKYVLTDTILISGCKADQVSMESPQYEHGVLTYHFTKVLNGQADVNGDGIVTIEEAVGEATKKIREKGWQQDPQLEGNRKDIVLIGRKELKTTTYGTIDEISAGVITISLGREHNVVKGSIYNVFDSTASSFADGSHKGRIRIDDVMGNSSYAKQIGEVSKPLLVGDKVVEYRRDFQPENLLLLVEPFEAKPQNEYVAKAIKGLMEQVLGKKKYVDIASSQRTPDKILRGSVKRASGNKYVIVARLIDVRRAEGEDYGPIKTTYFGLRGAANKLAELLMKEIRYSYDLKSLGQLENTQPGFKINLKVDKGNGGNLPHSLGVQIEKPQSREVSTKSATCVPSTPEQAEGTQNGDKVTVTVNPNRDCYIYLLNVDSSGAITVIFPNYREDNNFVRAGQKHVIQLTDEYASEIVRPPGQKAVKQGAIKAIATLKKIPLEMLKPGDMDNPFTYYKDNVRNMLETTMKDLRLPLHQWMAESMIYQVVLPRGGKEPMEIQKFE